MRLLIFHPAIAPYRIDFFNRLYEAFDTAVCLYYRNLKSQKFDYEKIEERLRFKPDYFSRSIRLGKREFYIGHISRIRKYRPDAVITGEYGPGLWLTVFFRFFSRKKYKVITICDDSFRIAEECRGVRRLSRNMAVRFIDGIIFCNDGARDWYDDHFKIRSFVFPIIQKEIGFYSDKPQAMEMAREYHKRYDLAGKRVFLFVGRLAPEKNLPYLVRSFIASNEKHPENVLFLVGGRSPKEPDLPEKLEGMIRDGKAEGYIHVAGHKEGTELKAWYYTAQVFVLPSTYEPFGAVVNEALLAGEYVMVSDVAGSASLVSDDNGCIIDIKKPQIDFDRVSDKIMPAESIDTERENRMPFSYDGKISGLVGWIRNL